MEIKLKTRTEKESVKDLVEKYQQGELDLNGLVIQLMTLPGNNLCMIPSESK